MFEGTNTILRKAKPQQCCRRQAIFFFEAHCTNKLFIN